jgi:NAD-reducing hydrogenase large subunit
MGIAEAPRGVLVHHYRVDENGAIRWTNLIVATGQPGHEPERPPCSTG